MQGSSDFLIPFDLGNKIVATKWWIPNYSNELPYNSFHSVHVFSIMPQLCTNLYHAGPVYRGKFYIP